MAQKQVLINSHEISYDDVTAGDAVRYLIHMGGVEAKVFFDEALSHGSAVFEDHFGHKYKLVHTPEGFNLIRI